MELGWLQSIGRQFGSCTSHLESMRMGLVVVSLFYFYCTVAREMLEGPSWGVEAEHICCRNLFALRQWPNLGYVRKETGGQHGSKGLSQMWWSMLQMLNNGLSCARWDIWQLTMSAWRSWSLERLATRQAKALVEECSAGWCPIWRWRLGASENGGAGSGSSQLLQLARRARGCVLVSPSDLILYVEGACNWGSFVAVLRTKIFLCAYSILWKGKNERWDGAFQFLFLYVFDGTMALSVGKKTNTLARAVASLCSAFPTNTWLYSEPICPA
jgi:hypothetical protein